jgi:hypothetical protein
MLHAVVIADVQSAADERAEPPDVVVPIAHDLALMTVMRATEAVIWPHPFAQAGDFGAHWGEAFTKPPIFDPREPAFEWDGDRWTTNVLGHGLFGSELYLRARTCRLPWYGALAMTAAASTVWEYAFEGNGVRPSALDLVYTPVWGLVFGEGRCALWRAAGGLEDRTARAIVRAVVDPLGEAERALGTGC